MVLEVTFQRHKFISLKILSTGYPKSHITIRGWPSTKIIPEQGLTLTGNKPYLDIGSLVVGSRTDQDKIDIDCQYWYYQDSFFQDCLKLYVVDLLKGNTYGASIPKHLSTFSMNKVPTVESRGPSF